MHIYSIQFVCCKVVLSACVSLAAQDPYIFDTTPRVRKAIQNVSIHFAHNAKKINDKNAKEILKNLRANLVEDSQSNNFKTLAPSQELWRIQVSRPNSGFSKWLIEFGPQISSFLYDIKLVDEMIQPFWDGRHYVQYNSINNAIYSIDIGTGTAIWSTVLPQKLKSAPIQLGKTVVCILDDFTLLRINVETGAEQPRVAIGTLFENIRNFELVGCFISSNTLFVSFTGKKDGQEVESFIQSFDMINGRQEWHIKQRGGIDIVPFVDRDQIYVAANGVISVFKAGNGSPLWQWEVPSAYSSRKRSGDRGAHKRSSFVDMRECGDVLLAALKTSEWDFVVWAISKKTGELLWNKSIEEVQFYWASTKEAVLVNEHRGIFKKRWLVCLDPETGSKRWEFQVHDSMLPWILENRVIEATEKGYCALDLRTGKPLWQIPLIEDVIIPPTPSGDSLLLVRRVGNGSEILALNPEDGTRKWAYLVSEKCAPGLLVATPNILLAPTSKGELVAYKCSPSTSEAVSTPNKPR